jgi:Predicted signal transduction protein with a C-terminal ATPase domain
MKFAGVRSLKTKFSHFSMRTKLFFLFSAMIVCILTLTMLLLNRIISDRYRERLVYSADQAYNQAYSFLSSQIETMVFVSELIYYNGDVQRVLRSQNVMAASGPADQYREFLRLDSVFSSVEMAENVYLARVFISENIHFANNYRHFAPISELEMRTDYQQFLEQRALRKAYFTAPELLEIPSIGYPVNIVSLLRTISATDGTRADIGVEQVCILTDRLKNVLDKANITGKDLVFLINRNGQIISEASSGNPSINAAQAKEMLSESEKDILWKKELLMGEVYFVNRRTLKEADWELVALIPEREFAAQAQTIYLTILLLTIPALMAVFAISYFAAGYYTRRLKKLADQMQSVRDGNFHSVLPDMGHDEIGALFESYRQMNAEIRNLMDAQYKSGKAVKSAQMKALQAQINPHFLYNTLDLINWEAMDHHAPEIAEITQSLARFYRISLNKGRQIVTIQEEVEHVQAYVNIQNRHFDQAIQLQVSIPDEILRLGCINIILQPFVENSIMHGIAKNPSIAECNIRITGKWEEDAILLIITDDGLGMTQKQMDELFSASASGKSHGYGVQNIESRLKLCYGEGYGLSYKSKTGSGTTVIIRLPAWTPEETEERVL